MILSFPFYSRVSLFFHPFRLCGHGSSRNFTMQNAIPVCRASFHRFFFYFFFFLSRSIPLAFLFFFSQSISLFLVSFFLFLSNASSRLCRLPSYTSFSFSTRSSSATRPCGNVSSTETIVLLPPFLVFFAAFLRAFLSFFFSLSFFFPPSRNFPRVTNIEKYLSARV